jgi:hypothetical protein
MNQLADRQAQFQAHLTSGAEAVTAHIIGDDKADSETRLQVYFQAYRLRLIEVLQNDFEGLHTLLGDEGFSRMVQAYLAKHPSRHPSVRWFGQHLPVFLGSQPEYAEHPVLAEMARFEWAWGLAFDAADRSAPGVAAMTEIDPEAWGHTATGRDRRQSGELGPVASRPDCLLAFVGGRRSLGPGSRRRRYELRAAVRGLVPVA